MNTDLNPYETPPEATGEMPIDLASPGITLIPRPLAMHTRKVVTGLGLFQLAWPMLVSPWTGSLFTDIWALFIAANGLVIFRSSFKRIPWTAVMCGVYPIALVVSAATHDLLSIRTWIPAQSSPVLLLQLVSTIWASYAIYCIVRCFLSHRMIPDDQDASAGTLRA